MAEIKIPIPNQEYFLDKFKQFGWIKIVAIVAFIFSLTSICYSFFNDYIVIYGDAESHLNLAKRVFDSITPGFAQLGGIWLPLPHILMLPFIHVDWLWRTGLAGSIVSGTAYVISCIYVYKLTFAVFKNKFASVFAFLVFATNPNILYLQSTPMTELPLICFFILSSYYFILFAELAKKYKSAEKTDNKEQDEEYIYLMYAAFFAFCASLSRYDGWFLVLIEAALIIIVYLPLRKYWEVFKSKKLQSIATIVKNKFYVFDTMRFDKMQGFIVLFSTLAFLGIGLWLLWDFLILGDPFYFTNSQFSARAQQLNWQKRGQLPTFHNLPLSFLYYFVTSMSDSGLLIFIMALIGLYLLIKNIHKIEEFLVFVLLGIPFLFNVITLWLGQSIIFIPHLTPIGFDWRIFNVRYGTMMMPFTAFFIAYLLFKSKTPGKLLIIFLIFIQFGLFIVGYSPVATFVDGKSGLSSAKRPDAERWLAKNYDDGLVLLDDYSRATSIIRSGIPMHNIIYIGNKPYWEDSLREPEKYAKWIIIQKEDDLWKGIYTKTDLQGRLYKYFKKVYTSTDILIFKKA